MSRSNKKWFKEHLEIKPAKIVWLWPISRLTSIQISLVVVQTSSNQAMKRETPLHPRPSDPIKGLMKSIVQQSNFPFTETFPTKKQQEVTVRFRARLDSGTISSSLPLFMSWRFPIWLPEGALHQERALCSAGAHHCMLKCGDTGASRLSRWCLSLSHCWTTTPEHDQSVRGHTHNAPESFSQPVSEVLSSSFSCWQQS